MAFVPAILSVVLILSPVFFPLSSGISEYSWASPGSELNYTEKIVTKQPTYSNVTITQNILEITSVNNQSFNMSEILRYSHHSNEFLNSTFPINSSIIIRRMSDWKVGEDIFFSVNSTILNSLKDHPTIYFNYPNAASPLNISKTNYTTDSQKIPAYALNALEHRPGGNRTTFNLNVTIYVDAFNGIVLYEDENQTFPETFFINTIYQFNGATFPMINSSAPQFSYLPVLITAIILSVIVLIVFYERKSARRRTN